MKATMYRPLLLAACFLLSLTVSVIKGDDDCSGVKTPTELNPCPAGLRDDGISCWKDSYPRGVGRVPDKSQCADGQRDDGTSCWIDSHGRGVGRSADISPCPSGLRDDGTSCWNDAHIYGKGCCCTLWGCCNKCPSGYHDDGCTCRKTNVGIIKTLFQRQSCKATEDKYGSRCYPKCAHGYHSVGCCVCEPDGPRVAQTLADRQSCHESETRYGGLCYPKCKHGYRSVGCCVCEPEEGPGIKITQPERQFCKGKFSHKINGVCVDIEKCSASDLERELQQNTEITPAQLEQFKHELAAAKAGK